MGNAEWGMGNWECGRWNSEKEIAECLIFIFSAFRIPNSEFERPAPRNLQQAARTSEPATRISRLHTCGRFLPGRPVLSAPVWHVDILCGDKTS